MNNLYEVNVFYVTKDVDPAIAAEHRSLYRALAPNHVEAEIKARKKFLQTPQYNDKKITRVESMIYCSLEECL